MQYNCPVCLSNNTTLRYTVKDHFLSGEEFRVQTCSECGFSFTLDSPDDDIIGKYYKSEEYISHSDTSKGITNRLYHLARSWMLRRKYKIVTRASGNKQGNLLDIGSGTGYFADYLQNKKWKSIGIEADINAKKYAEDKFGLEIYSLDKLYEFKSSEFNIVTLWHVLEHLSSPQKILKEISRVLDSAGSCIIALPNTDSFDSLYYKQYWAAWDVPRHLWHFNTSSFNKLIKESGLEILSIRRMPLDSFYISILSEKYRGSRISFIKGIIIGKLGWISSWFRKSRSSSLIYILGKKA